MTNFLHRYIIFFSAFSNLHPVRENAIKLHLQNWVKDSRFVRNSKVYYRLALISRPDLVLINRIEKSVYVLELTCSFERNIEAAHQRKTTKYTSLKTDIESSGYKCFMVPFEIGSRGHVTTNNKENIIHAFVYNKINSNALKCMKQLSRISLLCSFCIFHAYKQPTWSSPPFLSP